MASPTEVVRKYFQKVNELTELNAQVERKRSELLELQTEEDKILKRHETQAQKIREDRKKLDHERLEFDASVDKSHLAFYYSVEELTEQTVQRKNELSALRDEITSITKDIQQLELDKASLLGQLEETRKQLAGLNTEISKKQATLDSVLKNILQAKEGYETLKQAHNEVLEEAGDFEKKRKHLDLMERRIRNYYKKAGLTYRP